MTKKITISGLLIAMALVLSFLEGLVPVNLGIPGFKLGLANIVALVALFVLGPFFAIAVSVGRIIIGTFIFGNMAALLYSLSGGLLSLFIMIFLFKLKRPLFSIVAISTAGAVFHNIGQILAASFVIQDIRISYYLPILMLSGVAAGIFVGYVGKYIVSGLKNIKFIGLYDSDSDLRL